MKTIEMVDLAGQYQRLRPEIDAALAGVVESAAFIGGPDVRAFREELAAYLGVPHVIPCANGTDALQVALMALGLRPGDEVITPNFTFIATVEVLALLGLTPVLVDVDPDTFQIDLGAIRNAITGKTKAIIPVHLFGQPADMNGIREIASEYGLSIIEDNAQSLGAQHYCSDGTTRMAGTIGDIGTTSFYPSKPLACYGDGGALMTRDSRLAETLEMITNHGGKVKYRHEVTGVNSRLDSIQAAILRVNLRHLNDFIRRRQWVASYYDQQLGGHPAIRIPCVTSHGTHIYHQYTIRLEPGIRDLVRNQLKDKGIPTMVYYPVPLSRQPALAFAGYDEGDFPVTEELCRSVLSLPIHTEMNEEQLRWICTHLINIVEHETT